MNELATLNIETFYETNSVDKDFDENFYLYHYPETVSFYQPYCTDNNIDDRHRLFFHYKLYGKHLFKNQQQLDANTFTPLLSTREIQSNKLAILTTFFNPCNYINLQYNYHQFAEHISQYGDLFTIELSFNNNFFITKPNTIHIQGSDTNIIWQKERLLNILLDRLPPEYTDIAWIDCDIVFHDRFWPVRLQEILKSYKVVHLFDKAHRLDRHGIKTGASNSIINNTDNGVTGFAWAARREVLEATRFLDNQIIGGADLVMAASFLNRLDILEKRNHIFVNNDTTQRWIDNTIELVNKSVYCLNGDITHLYHGSLENRQYISRTNLIAEIENSKLSISNQLWSLDNQAITSKIKSFFINRKEDDNILHINNYFDNIYVLNLDRDQLKFNNISKKLNKLNILFQRFSAIDGNSLSNINFIKHKSKGFIENQFALGCCLSHAEIVRDAQKNQYKKILILEDDILFDTGFHAKLQSLRKIKDWKILYLGGSQYNWSDIDYLDNFYYAQKTLGTFAYGLDESVYNVLLDSITDSPIYTIDKYLSDLQTTYKKDCYVFYPNICIADVESSTIRSRRNQSQHNILMRWNISSYD